jgi:hypothetical protein
MAMPADVESLWTNRQTAGQVVSGQGADEHAIERTAVRE